jgi:molybdopterin molybdotransferase
VVVSTGGVSAGDSDWIRPLVAELGEVRFWKLFLKPGRPFAWGQVAGVPFFGLPGNPVAAAITALQLLWPALQRLEGAELQLLPRLQVQLQALLRRGAGQPELARARLVVAADGALQARVEGSGPPPASARCRGRICCWRSRPSGGSGGGHGPVGTAAAAADLLVVQPLRAGCCR